MTRLVFAVVRAGLVFASLKPLSETGSEECALTDLAGLRRPENFVTDRTGHIVNISSVSIVNNTVCG